MLFLHNLFLFRSIYFTCPGFETLRHERSGVAIFLQAIMERAQGGGSNSRPGSSRGPRRSPR